jgi:acetyl-CoA acetyltransferase
MEQNTIKDKAAIVGVGESAYYKRGGSPVPEFGLACQAIINAANDAGIKVTDIDGLASFAMEGNEPSRLAGGLGLRELNFCNMAWTGGGGVAAAVANAAAAVACGYAKYVAVFRALAQGQTFRFGQGTTGPGMAGLMGFTVPYGLTTPAQKIAMRVRRFMHEHKITQDALAAVSLAAYHHAQFNPRAVMYGRPLTREAYDNSRWIAEPFHLFDCCMENDGAAAVILTTAERARDLKQKPAYIMAAAQGSGYRTDVAAENSVDYPSANYKTVAPRLYQMAGITPKDVDVAQFYEHFSGGPLMCIVEHGFCHPDEVNQFCTFENLTAPKGGLPINTSGGNLAECYVHGMELVNEAVRQVRGQSTCQVPDAKIALVVSGPLVPRGVSNLLVHG